MDMRQMTSLGRAIEASSFDIVDAEAGPHNFSHDEWQIVRRVIHATADFEYQDLVTIHQDAIRSGISALRSGCSIIVDVNMIQAGLNEHRLKHYGCQVYSFISDPDVIEEAKANNSTRAIYAMKKAAKLNLLNQSIVLIGNAPTALLELKNLIESEGATPALVVGVPVGFVSAAESKQVILDTSVPSIVTKGRKGGSPIAVAILNALLYLTQDDEAKV